MPMYKYNYLKYQYLRVQYNFIFILGNPHEVPKHHPSNILLNFILSFIPYNYLRLLYCGQLFPFIFYNYIILNNFQDLFPR